MITMTLATPTTCVRVRFSGTPANWERAKRFASELYDLHGVKWASCAEFTGPARVDVDLYTGKLAAVEAVVRAYGGEMVEAV